MGCVHKEIDKISGCINKISIIEAEFPSDNYLHQNYEIDLQSKHSTLIILLQALIRLKLWLNDLVEKSAI